MEMTITLPGGDRVDAHFSGLSLATHQDGSAPAPFDLFLASIGTCAGIYVAKFCQKRGIPTDEIRIKQRAVFNSETHMVEKLMLDIEVPESFPPQYREAVVRSAGLCAVKRHLEQPPKIEVRTV